MGSFLDSPRLHHPSLPTATILPRFRSFRLRQCFGGQVGWLAPPESYRSSLRPIIHQGLSLRHSPDQKVDPPPPSVRIREGPGSGPVVPGTEECTDTPSGAGGTAGHASSVIQRKTKVKSIRATRNVPTIPSRYPVPLSPTCSFMTILLPSLGLDAGSPGTVPGIAASSLPDEGVVPLAHYYAAYSNAHRGMARKREAFHEDPGIEAMPWGENAGRGRYHRTLGSGPHLRLDRKAPYVFLLTKICV